MLARSHPGHAEDSACLGRQGYLDSIGRKQTADLQMRDDARRIFVAQKLGNLVGQMLDTAVNAPIDQVTVIDGSLTSGENGSLAARAAVASKELEQGLGIDIPGVLGGLATSLSMKALPDMTALVEES